MLWWLSWTLAAQESLTSGLLRFSNEIPNRYLLGFQTQAPHPGLHTLSLTLPDHPGLVVEARSSYWSDAIPANVSAASTPPRNAGP